MKTSATRNSNLVAVENLGHSEEPVTVPARPPKFASPLFFIMGKPGQLGNRLFFFSYVISLAMKLGGRVANSGFAEFAPAFAATEGDAFSRWPPRHAVLRARWLAEALFEIVEFGFRAARKLRLSIPGVKLIGIHQDLTAEHGLQNESFLESLRGARVVFICGWIDLTKTQFEHPDRIRAFFAPAESHRAAVDRVVAGARRECEVLVGVHIRQGDYAVFEGGRFYFSTELYLKNMRHTRALFPGMNVGFIVCSNFPQSIADPALPRIYCGPGHPVEDLYALAACDYIIGPPSTFSRWASFYGQVPLWEMRDGDSVPELDDFEVCSQSASSGESAGGGKLKAPAVTPLVSICIPCFNAERWITEAVQSALAQTWPAVEVIVVDDGSTDGSLEKLKEFGDAIRVIKGRHRGSNAARNLALQSARGEWIQFLDADDYLLPEKLARQFKEGANADVIFSPLWTEKDGERSLMGIDAAEDTPALWLSWQLPQTGGGLWRKSALDRIGGWNEATPCCQEYELYLRALQAGFRFSYAPTPNAIYRIWSEETLCRKDPVKLAEVRTELALGYLEWLRARNLLKENHVRIASRGFFEMNRTIARYDLPLAERYHRERKRDGLIRLAGPAAPCFYRAAYHVLGFGLAERLAAFMGQSLPKAYGGRPNSSSLGS